MAPASPPKLDHRKLLLQAKQRQKALSNESASLSELIAKTVHAIIKINSVNTGLACAPVLDKITTIHELDREIDRQLNKDIAGNYENLLHSKRKLAEYIKKTQYGIAMDTESHESYVDLLQRRVELIDQDLRILEHTLRLVEEHREER